MAGVSSDILEYLKDYHTEETSAIKARDLCTLFNLTDRQLRTVVSGLRQDGEAVCSSSYGYWYSNDTEDIKKTLRRLEEQVKNMNSSIKGLTKALNRR